MGTDFGRGKQTICDAWPFQLWDCPFPHLWGNSGALLAYVSCKYVQYGEVFYSAGFDMSYRR